MARFLMKYRCYNWKTKNPVIDKTRTILQDEGMYAKSKRQILHQLSGVSVSTYDGWFEGDTVSPRHETIMATLAALGYEEQFVKANEINLEKELEAAGKWREQQERNREKAKPNGKGKKK
jgi:transcriptional regulator with XRE-family HTH domain